MIGAIVIPTPKGIKRKLKGFINKYGTKERTYIYMLVGSGVVLTVTTDIPAKCLILGSLIFNGVSFEILEKWYTEVENHEELKKLTLKYDVFTAIRIIL